MRKLISILTLSAFITVGCNLPTEPQIPNEIDSIEMMLASVNDTDVPVTLSKGDDDKKGKGKKGIRGRKHSFRKVMHRMQRYLTNHPNDEAQEYLDSAKANMKTLYGMKKDGVKDGFRELVKETRQLLRKAIKVIREARKSD
jgi:hypothetical protein